MRHRFVCQHSGNAGDVFVVGKKKVFITVVIGTHGKSPYYSLWPPLNLHPGCISRSRTTRVPD
jgi:hypothetical protein